MLILQSIITIITYVPYAIVLIYTNVTQIWSKSSLRIDQEKVFTELTHLIFLCIFCLEFLYINDFKCWISSTIYTLSSNTI